MHAEIYNTAGPLATATCKYISFLSKVPILQLIKIHSTHMLVALVCTCDMHLCSMRVGGVYVYVWIVCVADRYRHVCVCVCMAYMHGGVYACMIYAYMYFAFYACMTDMWCMYVCMYVLMTYMYGWCVCMCDICSGMHDWYACMHVCVYVYVGTFVCLVNLRLTPNE